MNAAHRYFRCIGCGGIAGVLLESSEAGPAGSVFHMKPQADANVRVVQCKLYQQLSAEDFARLHAAQPELQEMAGGKWQLCKEPASDQYLAEWLAGQFETTEQLRAYLALSREERIACFPPATALADLDDAGWQKLGTLALRVRYQRTKKGASN